MKKIIFAVLCIIATTLTFKAANNEAMSNIRPELYFSEANILDSTLILNAKPTFGREQQKMKEDIIQHMLLSTGTKRVIVNSADNTSLWYIVDGKTYSSEWSTTQNSINDYNYVELDRLGPDKWFFNIGGEYVFSDGFFLNLNARVGTYLYKNILDAGFGVSAGLFWNGDDTNFDMNINITGRFYFTRLIKKPMPLAPFVGVGLGYVILPKGTFEPLVTAGVNWYLSKGSIDLAIQYGTASKFGFTAGYTITF